MHIIIRVLVHIILNHNRFGSQCASVFRSTVNFVKTISTLYTLSTISALLLLKRIVHEIRRSQRTYRSRRFNASKSLTIHRRKQVSKTGGMLSSEIEEVLESWLCLKVLLLRILRLVILVGLSSCVGLVLTVLHIFEVFFYICGKVSSVKREHVLFFFHSVCEIVAVSLAW